jgi:hypothetical protein
MPVALKAEFNLKVINHYHRRVVFQEGLTSKAWKWILDNLKYPTLNYDNIMYGYKFSIQTTFLHPITF